MTLGWIVVVAILSVPLALNGVGWWRWSVERARLEQRDWHRSIVRFGLLANLISTAVFLEVAVVDYSNPMSAMAGLFYRAKIANLVIAVVTLLIAAIGEGEGSRAALALASLSIGFLWLMAGTAFL